MSLDLKDFRGRITPETHCMLEARAQVTGKEKQEIVRDILHEWASCEIKTARIAQRYLQLEGVAGTDDASAWDVRERRGRS